MAWLHADMPSVYFEGVYKDEQGELKQEKNGQPGYGNGTAALSEEMWRNGSAVPTFPAPSPDPTKWILEHRFWHYQGKFPGENY